MMRASLCCPPASPISMLFGDGAGLEDLGGGGASRMPIGAHIRRVRLSRCRVAGAVPRGVSAGQSGPWLPAQAWSFLDRFLSTRKPFVTTGSYVTSSPAGGDKTNVESGFFILCMPLAPFMVLPAAFAGFDPSGNVLCGLCG